jgi:hypothetical protein
VFCFWLPSSPHPSNVSTFQKKTPSRIPSQTDNTPLVDSPPDNLKTEQNMIGLVEGSNGDTELCRYKNVNQMLSTSLYFFLFSLFSWVICRQNVKIVTSQFFFPVCWC